MTNSIANDPKIVIIGEPTQELFDLQAGTIAVIKRLLPRSEVEAVGALAVPMVGRPGLVYNGGMIKLPYYEGSYFALHNFSVTYS